MNPVDNNTPVGENKDQFMEGSFQAINGKKDEDGVEENKESKKTIEDIQNDTDPGSAEDAAREQGPYGVQEEL